MDQVAAALEAERSRLFDAMTAGRVEAADNDRRSAAVSVDDAGGRLPFEDLGPYAKALPSRLEQRGDLASDGGFVLARDHPAIEQQIAGGRQHVVGIAAADAGDGQAGLSDQRMAARLHLALMRLGDHAEQLGRTQHGVVAEMRCARMGGHAVHADAAA